LIDVSLSVAAGGWLEYLPQDTILFEGARMRRRTAIERQGGARVLAGEILVFGRTARGESLSRGLIRDSWEVRREGRLAWADALHMDGELAALLADPACFAGAKACATLLYSADDAPEGLDAVRGELVALGDLKVAATVVNGQLVVRWIALDAQVLRPDYARIWAMMRHRIAGLPQALPRLWHV
jgi:urease accessory protein